MNWWWQVVNTLAALIVLAEALNKLERADLWGGRGGLAQRLRCLGHLATPWRWTRPAAVLVLKVLGWALISIGAAGVLAGPLLSTHWPLPATTAVVSGFALLIIRSRLKEG